MSQRVSDLLLLSINHETVPLSERERYAINNVRIAELYRRIDQIPEVEEALILNTCNRFELYCRVSADRDVASAILNVLSDFQGVSKTEVGEHAAVCKGHEVVNHLIEVSAGLRSQITGEAEIFGQVKDAYATCRSLGYAGSALNRVFQKAFQAAKAIRQHTSIGQGNINIANVAVDLSSKIFGKLSGTSALVIGTGAIGEKTLKALRSRGVGRFGIASRSLERGERLSEEWRARPRKLEEIASYLHEYDIVIACTQATEPIVNCGLAKVAAERRRGAPLFLVDLGMPRNIDPDCGEADNLFLYNLDDLAAIAERNLHDRRAAIGESEVIARQRAAGIWQMLQRRNLVG